MRPSAKRGECRRRKLRTSKAKSLRRIDAGIRCERSKGRGSANIVGRRGERLPLSLPSQRKRVAMTLCMAIGHGRSESLPAVGWMAVRASKTLRGRRFGRARWLGTILIHAPAIVSASGRKPFRPRRPRPQTLAAPVGPALFCVGRRRVVASRRHARKRHIRTRRRHIHSHTHSRSHRSPDAGSARR
jgi:hypothetical protein